MRDFEEIMYKAIDMPILLQYSETECRSAGSPSMSAFEAANSPIGMKAGKSAQMHHAISGK